MADDPSRIHRCTPFTLPSHGVLQVNPTSTITLTSDALFTPECRNSAAPTIPFAEHDDISCISDVKDPFYASTIPQAYATGAATVVAWMLVFMLLITPRTFFVSGAGGGFGLLGRRGIISGSRGGPSVIGVGSRPWLQKTAALTVAVSMTIVTSKTFQVAEQQYDQGYMDAMKLRAEVVGNKEIKISRVISDVFVWLALIQTLIRLFPRHNEKVLIKWIGFALIIFDATFSCLNSFIAKKPLGRPERFQDAIPALSYLFQLALSMLYAVWVMYYAVTKRRFAFYHGHMWNISLVALLSIVAIFTPVVFFIIDISNQSLAGWGDYFRWVGAAAASVIVWEWVERIEAIEREEKKDGILGREIFDGDEMLDVAPSVGVNWPRSERHPFWSTLRKRKDNNDDGAGGGGCPSGAGQPTSQGHKLAAKAHVTQRDAEEQRSSITPTTSSGREPLSSVPETASTTVVSISPYQPIATPPPVAVTPISRADTNSVASTVYTVRYHSVHTPVAPLGRTDVLQAVEPSPSTHTQGPLPADQQRLVAVEIPRSRQMDDADGHDQPVIEEEERQNRWHHPFKRRKVLPPAEVRRGQVIGPVGIAQNPQPPAHNFSKWDIKGRLGAFAAEQGEKFLEKRRRPEAEVDLPVTIIPAQPRGRTWSPDMLSAPESATAGIRSRSRLRETSPNPAATATPGTTATTDSDAPWPINPASPPPPGVGHEHATQDQPPGSLS